MRGLFLIGVALTLLGAPAVARDKRFQPYEGVDAVREGRGGTKVESHGIEIWTTGEPPRKYRVLGAMIDKRTGMLSGSALRSSAFADRIRAQGGDAAIVLNAERRTVGGFQSGGAWAYTPQKVTQFLVVKYESTPVRGVDDGG